VTLSTVASWCSSPEPIERIARATQGQRLHPERDRRAHATGTQIEDITIFRDPGALARFGLPDRIRQ
jgi:hypothetical protein